MAEEHSEHHHGHSHGHVEEHKDKDKALYWSLGLGAAGLVVALLLFMGGGNKKQGTNTVVQPSTPFMPNGTDVSIGTVAAHLYWPGLPTSGTPHHPKTHKRGDTDKDGKHPAKHHTNKPNDHKGYGTSPNGASHGHTVTHHGHNPQVVSNHTGTKGHGNG